MPRTPSTPRMPALSAVIHIQSAARRRIARNIALRRRSVFYRAVHEMLLNASGV